jgi:hypothetical protein
MGIARNLARLVPNGSGELPTANIAASAITRAKLDDASELQTQLFTSSGTFTVPAGVTKVYVSGCGGGGGTDSDEWSTGGGGGAWCFQVAVGSLTPGNTISVTVGAAGATNSSGGTSGGTTSFGSYITLGGGSNGGNNNGTSGGYAAGGSASLGGGATGINGSGGSGKYSVHASAGHGEGGQSLFGWSGRNSDNSNTTNNTCGYGGGAHSSWGSAYTAAPTQGFILVEW